VAVYMNEIKTLRRRVDQRDGFTLIELMVVMSILISMAMMVTLVFSDSLKNIRQENAARDLFSAMNYAHSRAITESTLYRLYLDRDAKTYWIEKEVVDREGVIGFYMLDENEFAPGELGDTLEMKKPNARYDRKNKLYYVDFFPNGLCDAVEIVVAREGRSRETFVITTDGMKIRMKLPER